MPPKMFKIKKAEKGQNDDNDNADDLLISDYQQQRLINQAQQAEVKQAEETRRQAEAEASNTAVGKPIDNNNSSAGHAKSGVGARGLARAPAGAAPPRPTSSFTSTASYGIAEALPVDTMDSVLGAPAQPSSNYYPPMALKANGVSTTLVAAPPLKSGTAFLEEAHRERLAAYHANKSFFDNYGQKGNDDVNTEANEAFMLMQLPKPVKELATSCTLEHMAPGKIGKLTVYKSGRTTMTIGNVTVDVAMEPQQSQAGGGGEGISQYAVAVDNNDRARRGCYQMCWVPRKVVCTPQLDDEE